MRPEPKLRETRSARQAEPEARFRVGGRGTAAKESKRRNPVSHEMGKAGRGPFPYGKGPWFFCARISVDFYGFQKSAGDRLPAFGA
jgi:hypothetical protein